MALIILTVGTFWYLRWRKQGGGNQVSEYDKGQLASSVLGPAGAPLPYYVSPFTLVANLRDASFL